MDNPHATLCGARMSAGRPCTRRPAAGRPRCRYHGGAQGSGAQAGNSNALKHGFYSTRVRELADDILAAADQPLEFFAEIALLRAVLARAAGSAQPLLIATVTNTLARLVRAQHNLPPTEPVRDESSPEAIAEREAYEEIARQLNEAILKEQEAEDEE